MKKILKAFAIVATSFALMACNASVSSDPQTITNPKYNGDESQFPKNISLVTKQDGVNHVAKITHGTNYEFEITYEPYSTNNLQNVAYVASHDVLQNVGENGQQALNYLIHVKYPDDGKFTKADFENLTSQMIWPLIVREKLSKPEADAAVAVFNEYVRDYMVAYSKAQNLQGAERENIFASAGKYANLKHHVNYAELPKMEITKFIQKTDDPKSDNSTVFDMKINLKNGKTYNYVVFSTIPPADFKMDIKENNQWRSVTLFLKERGMENAQEIIEEMYKTVKNSNDIDMKIAETYQTRLNKLPKF